MVIKEDSRYLYIGFVESQSTVSIEMHQSSPQISACYNSPAREPSLTCISQIEEYFNSYLLNCLYYSLKLSPSNTKHEFIVTSPLLGKSYVAPNESKYLHFGITKFLFAFYDYNIVIEIRN